MTEADTGFDVEYEPDADELERINRSAAIDDVIRAVLKGEAIPAHAVTFLADRGGQLRAYVWVAVAQARKYVDRWQRSPETIGELIDETASRESWRTDPGMSSFSFVPMLTPRPLPMSRTSRPRVRPRGRRVARARSPGRPGVDDDPELAEPDGAAA